MIIRYVFVRLNDQHHSADARAKVARKSSAWLRAIPGVRDVQVGIPADAGAEGAWDLSIAVSFDDIADVEPYRVHPEHRRYVDEYLRPRMQVIKAWNFEVGF